jgi:diadenosine tetraphosphate (Ap4A) HIT family hydrolase
MSSQHPTCAACGFDLWIPVAELAVSSVGFYDDGRFPGRCIVMLREHFDHLDEVPGEIAAAFTQDQQQVGASLRLLTGVERVNYAVLGNTLPHVHAHIIPRYEDDPVPTRPSWEHPDPQRKCSLALRDQVVAHLKRALAA